MTTIRRVAKDAKVSIATVSRVLNQQPGVSDAVRHRVLDSVNRSGYVASVGKRSTSLLGFVYTGPSSVDSTYDSALFAGAFEAMEQSDFDLVCLNLHRGKRSAETYTQFFLRKGVRGVILRTTRQSRTICEAIASEGFPAIVIGEKFERPDISFVRCDSYSATYRGMEHLIGLGHVRIALAIADIVHDSDHADRLAAYTQALQDAGIEVDRGYHFHIPARRPDGAQVIRQFMSMPVPPTAVVVTDPLVAVGALAEAHRLGLRIPTDLSILGFDDAEIRHQVFPAMTAACQDARRLGFEAFVRLSKFVNSTPKHDPVREEFPTWLEINQSTGEPSNGNHRPLNSDSRLSR